MSTQATTATFTQIIVGLDGQETRRSFTRVEPSQEQREEQDRIRNERDAAVNASSQPKQQSLDEVLALYPFLSEPEKHKVAELLSIPSFAQAPKEWVHDEAGHSYEGNMEITNATSARAIADQVLPTPSSVLIERLRSTLGLSTPSSHLVLSLQRGPEDQLYLYYKAIATSHRSAA